MAGVNPNNSYRGSMHSNTSHSGGGGGGKPPKLGSARANTSYAGSVNSNMSYPGVVNTNPQGRSTKPPSLGSASANTSYTGSVSTKPPKLGSVNANTSYQGSINSNTSYPAGVNTSPAYPAAGGVNANTSRTSYPGSVNANPSYPANVNTSRTSYTEGMNVNTSLAGSGMPEASLTGSGLLNTSSQSLGSNASDTSQVKIQLHTTYPGSQAPPSYNTSFHDKPPAYDNVFGRVQQAKDESSGNVDFAQRVVAIACCGAICTLINLVFLFTIPIINLVIGIIYIDNCPLQTKIPVFLMVGGIAGIVKGVVALGICCVQKLQGERDEEAEKKARPNPLDMIINLFLFIWFLCGSVWTFGVKTEWQWTNKDGDDYCHEVCYRYAFWFLIICYIFLALGILCCCAGLIVSLMVAFKK